MENLSRVFQKQKRKKTHEGIEFHLTQFTIEFLLPFTGGRKVLGKIPSRWKMSKFSATGGGGISLHLPHHLLPNPLSTNPTKWSNTLKQLVG